MSTAATQPTTYTVESRRRRAAGNSDLIHARKLYGRTISSHSGGVSIRTMLSRATPRKKLFSRTSRPPASVRMYLNGSRTSTGQSDHSNGGSSDTAHPVLVFDGPVERQVGAPVVAHQDDVVTEVKCVEQTVQTLRVNIEGVSPAAAR
jgi:hypothetical protein